MTTRGLRDPSTPSHYKVRMFEKAHAGVCRVDGRFGTRCTRSLLSFGQIRGRWGGGRCLRGGGCMGAVRYLCRGKHPSNTRVAFPHTLPPQPSWAPVNPNEGFLENIRSWAGLDMWVDEWDERMSGMGPPSCPGQQPL